MNRMLRSLISITAVVGLTAACGDSDSDAEAGVASDPDVATTTAEESDESGSDESVSGDDSTSGGSGNGTITVADGTAHQFEMTQCRTKTNAPSFFLIENGYDMAGRTADGSFRMVLLRAASTEENALGMGDLRAEFDENGQNPKTSYRFVEPDSTFVLNGNTLTGELMLFDFNSANPIYGDETTGTIEIVCPETSS